MFFTLKKIVGGLLLPLPTLLLLVRIGIVLLWFNHFQRAGKLYVNLGWLLLALLNLQPVADSLLKPIKDSYSTWRGEQPVSYVAVSGGGYIWNPEWAPDSNLISNSLPRLMRGIRLWQANPGSKMVFTGAAAKTNPTSTARAGARVVESFGVSRSDIIVLDRPKGTEERAQAAKRAIGDASSLPIISVPRLPRAMIFFRRAGLGPLPTPAGQLAVTSPFSPWERVISSPAWLVHSDWVGYETLGRVWR